MFDGEFVGFDVGFIVGLEDGMFVGEMDGIFVDSFVGYNVVIDGFSVGGVG